MHCILGKCCFNYELVLCKTLVLEQMSFIALMERPICIIVNLEFKELEGFLSIRLHIVP